ncbi:hypothetical protein SAMN05216567_112141 [Variovorax sp. OK605]|nr:hypothetical protein SAMN05216567_112141 [Variovorax sp. OK605]
MADNRWYMVTAQCLGPQGYDGKIIEFIAITEGNGKEDSKDNARFAFSRAIEAGPSTKECQKKEIDTRDAAAAYVGESRSEAQGYLDKKLAKDAAAGQMINIVMNYDAMKNAEAATEQRRVDAVNKGFKDKKDAANAEAAAGAAKGAAKKEKHDAYCKAEGSAKGDCSCPLPKGTKVCSR